MRLGVISPYHLTREGMRALLTSRNYAVVVDLSNFPDDLSVLREAQPEILLLQASGRASDLELVSRLRKVLPKIKVLLLVDKTDEETEFQALRAGAWGCVSRATDLDTLVRACDIVGGGDIWVSQRVATRFIGKLAESENGNHASGNGLTRREWEILGLLASGSRNKEIANRLTVSENTVKTHLYTLYRKINVDCRLAATLYYFQHAKSNGDFSPKPASPQRKRKKTSARSDQGEQPMPA
jgi:two-component system secretion response regulator SsrB